MERDKHRQNDVPGGNSSASSGNSSASDGNSKTPGGSSDVTMQNSKIPGRKSNAAGRNKVASVVYSVIRYLSTTFLIVQIIIVSYVVFGRFVLNKTPRWGEVTSLLCMVWFSLLSASMAEYNQAHIGVKLNRFFLPQWGIKAVEVLNFLIKVIISVFMIFQGIKLSITTRGGILPGLDISSAWLYLSIPVSGFFLLFMLIMRFLEGKLWQTR